jgi:hypothetical protein
LGHGFLLLHLHQGSRNFLDFFSIYLLHQFKNGTQEKKKKGSNEGSSSGKKVMDFRKVSSLIPDARKERYKEFFHEI